MNDQSVIPFNRVQRIAWVIGGLGVVSAVIGVITAPEQFFQAYLMAYLFWWGITLSCLGLALLHYLAGGQWGTVIVRSLEAGAKTLPWMMLLFVPLIFGIKILYVWARPEVVAQDAVLQYKSLYLNIPFFLIRAALYFLIWLALTYVATRWSLARDRTAEAVSPNRLQRLGAVGLIVLSVTASFAAIDWIMSLEPHWYSTIYAMLILTGEVLAGFAFIIVIVALLARYRPLADVITPQIYIDLGSLLLAAVMIWAYLAFSQYLIIWSGNTQEEIPWYLRRLQGGWEWVAFAVLVFSFVLPFLMLLSRDLKRSARPLIIVGSVLVIARFIDMFWIVTPAFNPASLTIHWLDLVLPIGLGGLWIALFIRQLKLNPLLPLYATRLVEKRAEPEQSLEHG